MILKRGLPGKPVCNIFQRIINLPAEQLAFTRKVNDVIFFFYNPVTFSSQYINQDKQKDHGFELEASYKIANTTTLKAFYTYTTGEITTQQAGKDTTYNNLLRRPKIKYRYKSWQARLVKTFLSVLM